MCLKSVMRVLLMALCTIAAVQARSDEVCGFELPARPDPEPLKKADFADIPRSNQQRQQWIRERWADKCDELILLPVRVEGRLFSNLICRLEGQTEDTLLITAHFDRAGSGEGVADNWTGIRLADRLLDWFTTHRPYRSVELVALAGEEAGMQGSRAWVRERFSSRYRVVMNLDTLGLDDLKIESNAPPLHCLATALADRHNIPLSGQHVRALESDFDSFKRAGLPGIHLHSVGKRGKQLIHTSRDRVEAVDFRKLNQALLLAVHLGQTLSAPQVAADEMARQQPDARP
ncbi:MAG: M28 family peptidase [Pseudomonadales bacterium]|nr:M28 family peptidase [Pseudomonadales bacterium]